MPSLKGFFSPVARAKVSPLGEHSRRKNQSTTPPAIKIGGFALPIVGADGGNLFDPWSWKFRLKALFNFIRNNLNAQLPNPCDTPMLKKLFRPGKLEHWQVQEKETIDEVISRTTKVRNRLMLELMARGGMRMGEVEESLAHLKSVEMFRIWEVLAA